ncbi:30S ribosomal protein S20 [Desulfovibrio cuneatus]|uniref:30S ribosomal protein S20 n=1 Tax=Desulfovibrio cuneatus TaxID=159728 RepID=UPI000404122B|nr:30S ribosomal protein S20 [Desulfovibrio cuneatus]
MANHKSAIKRHKQSLKKADRNRAVRTRVKNVVKEMRTAILENNPENIEVALKKATIAIDKSASKGVLHWKTAARKISRLAKAANAAAKAQ